MSVLGMFNLATGTVEGVEDPGNLFRKKQHILSVLSVLGLLNLKGCNEDMPESSNASFGVMAFTLLFGFSCLLAWIWMRGERVELAAPLEPDAEPETTTNPHTVDDYADVSHAEVPSSSTDLPTTTRPARTHPALTALLYQLDDRALCKEARWDRRPQSSKTL